MATLAALVEAMLDLAYFHPLDGAPAAIPWRRVPGTHPRLWLVLGDNASGKSLCRRLLGLLAREAKVEPLTPSLETRIGGGLGRLLIYGDETRDATGVNSAAVVRGAFSTSAAREHPHLVVLDEPDLGLSDAWAASVGEYVAARLATPSPHLVGCVVITHRRALVAALAPLDPPVLFVGDDRPASLAAWAAATPPPRDLLDLIDQGDARQRAIERVLDYARRRRGDR